MSGLEVIGSVASVLQLAATVYSISKTLYEVGDALSNAPSDIKDLARDLETFSEELHLLSSLLSDKTHRYSDRVYQLTAKIIGDCASICVKIDRILRKLRTGSFLARVKWVFKEKEIMKLLARLRDLKLSLMGTLSLLSALKADHLMDAMGVGNPSLLEGPKDELLSKETAEDLEETRRKLAGITAGQNPGTSLPATVSGSTLTPSVSQSSEDSQRSVTSSEKETDAPDASQSFSSSATSLTSTVSSHVGTKPRSIEQPNAPIFISAIASPQPNAVMQIPQAMASVQSFYSALSRHDNEDLEAPDTRIRSIATSDTRPSSIEANSSKKLAESRVEEWKADIIHSAMKRFGMTREDAISWVSTLPVPSFPDSEVQDNAFLVDEDPERVQKKTDDAEGTGPKGMEQMSRNFLRFACPARPLTPSPEMYCESNMDSDEGRAWLKANREARRGMRRSSKTVRKRTLAQSIGSSSDDEDILSAVFERTNEAGSSARLRRKIAGERTSLLFDGRLIGREDAPDADLDFEETRGGSNDNWEIQRSMGKRPFNRVEDIENSLSDTAAEDFHENQIQTEIDDSYNQQATEEYITTVDVPGQWISDGDYSEDTNYVVKRRVITRPDERSSSPHHKRHLAEGVLSGAEAAALLRNHTTATIPPPWERGKPTAPTTPSTLASKLSNLTIDPVNGASTPASHDSMGYPPNSMAWKRGKPAALHLAPLNTKPLQQAKLSQALQSLMSARPLIDRISSIYPPGISPPKGDGLRYDIEFLLQFQKVFTEKPSIDFKSHIEALIADGNKISIGSGGLSRNVKTVIVEKHPFSYRPASARPGLGTKVPPSEDRREMVVRGAALGAIGAEVITRARSRDRGGGEDQSRSRSRSESRGSHAKLKTSLGLTAAGLAAAAAAKYVQNRTGRADRLERGRGRGRGRSRTRSVSRRRRSYSYTSDENRPTNMQDDSAEVTRVVRNSYRYRDDYSSDDGDGRSRAEGNSYRTVQRYRVTPSRVEASSDETGPSRPSFPTWLHNYWSTMQYRHERIATSVISQGLTPLTREMIEMHVRNGPDDRNMSNFLPLVTPSGKKIFREKLRSWPGDARKRSISPTKSWSGPWNATPVSQQHVSQNVSDEDAEGEEYDDERNQDVDCLMLPSPANEAGSFSDEDLELDLEAELEEALKSDRSTSEEDNQLTIVSQRKIQNHYQGYVPPGVTKKALLEKDRRASKPKIKTGCFNCTGRRVKCDETRPQCQKCVRSGRECDGYPAYKRVNAVPIAIAPKDGSATIKPSSSGSSSSLSTTPSSLPTLRASFDHLTRREFHKWRSSPPAPPKIHLPSPTDPTAFLRYFHHYVPYRMRYFIYEQGAKISGFTVEYPREIRLSLGTEALLRTHQYNFERLFEHRETLDGVSSHSISDNRNRDDSVIGTRRKREFRKRTKTGCLNCRKRRIKCGEERPTCQNCHKSKRQCEGYNQRVVFKNPLNAYRGPLIGIFPRASGQMSTSPAGNQFRQVSAVNPLPIASRPGPLGAFPTAQIPEEKTEDDDDAMAEDGFDDDFFNYEEEMGKADEDVDDLKDETQVSSQPAKLGDSLHKIVVPVHPFLSEYRQNDLWLRAFAQLYAQDSESCQGLSRAWVAACENSPPLTGSEHLVAGMAATRLWSVIDKVQMQLLETPTETKRPIISSIDRFSDILKVMQETLNFKTGFYIWTCLCFAEQEILESLSMAQVLKNSQTLEDLSEVATLVARYNVLESMYKQWPGMSLEPNYETSLIELCVRVLRYLDLVLSRPSASEQNDFEKKRIALMAMIRSADVACRGFSVTIVGEVESKGMERDVEDISADEDDSDSTERG